MLVQLEALHSYILQGKSECHVFEAAPSCTGGKVFKNCNHQVRMPLLVKLYIRLSTISVFLFQYYYLQVISATKYIVKKESTRDHVDLLLSCKHWPLVYAVDMACDVVAHMEARLPQMAAAIWGNRRGCFEKPCPGRAPQVQICCSLEIVYFALHLHTFIFNFADCSSTRTQEYTK